MYVIIFYIHIYIQLFLISGHSLFGLYLEVYASCLIICSRLFTSSRGNVYWPPLSPPGIYANRASRGEARHVSWLNFWVIAQWVWGRYLHILIRRVYWTLRVCVFDLPVQCSSRAPPWPDSRWPRSRQSRATSSCESRVVCIWHGRSDRRLHQDHTVKLRVERRKRVSECRRKRLQRLKEGESCL